MTSPTWAQLLVLEPRLGDLMSYIRRVREDEDFCANEIWYGSGDDGGVKEKVSQLVGWDRKPDRALGSEEAYDVAYESLYDELPNCRHPEGGCRG